MSAQRVKGIFFDALDHPEEGRKDFVRRACGEDRRMLAEVLSLL